MVWPGMPFPNLDGRIHQSRFFFLVNAVTVADDIAAPSINIPVGASVICMSTWPYFDVSITLVDVFPCPDAVYLLYC